MRGREELGEYFAVDIGGTNYRVIYVKLSPDKGKVVSTRPDTTLPLADESGPARASTSPLAARVDSHRCHMQRGAWQEPQLSTCLPVSKQLPPLTPTGPGVLVTSHGHGAHASLTTEANASPRSQERMDMEDCRIPDEYFTCPAVGLFDLLAGELARFAQRMDRCSPGWSRHACTPRLSCSTA